jgi:hypothetical protein
MRVVAFDPGKRNFAYASVFAETCSTHGHIETIVEMKQNAFSDQVIRFCSSVNTALAGTRPGDWFCFERMQHRPGSGSGAVIEYINLMLGLCVGIAQRQRLRIYPVSAVTWKNHFIKQRGLDRARFSMTDQKLSIRQPAGSPTKTKTELVSGLLHGQPESERLSPHEGDAIGIACYVWEQLTGKPIVDHVLVN